MYQEYIVWGFFIGLPLGVALGIMYIRLMRNVFKKRRERKLKLLKEG